MSADCSLQVVESQHRSGDLILANDKISTVGQKPPLLHRHLAPYLFHPLLLRMGCDSGQTNPPTLQLDKEQHVVGNQPFERKHFHRKEICSHQNIPYGKKTHLRFRGREVYPTEGSCRFPLIVLQQTTQSFLATHDSVIPEVGRASSRGRVE